MGERSRPLAPDLSGNLAELKRLFGDTEDLVIRRISLGPGSGQQVALAYLQGTVDQNAVSDQVIERLTQASSTLGKDSGPIREVGIVKELLVSTMAVEAVSSWSMVTRSLPAGVTALLVDGLGEALLLHLKVSAQRAITEPEANPVIRGSREGFLESIELNLALLRRRIRTPQLHVQFLTVGELTRTQIAVVHLRGIARQEVLDEVLVRLKRIRIDGALESGYLEEFIQDAPFSLFATVRSTERVDVAAGSLLEGRVAILTDGTPFVLIVPVTFSGMLQTSEDYNMRWPLATFVRWVRYLATTIALTLTGLYVAILSYNQEIVPFGLALRLAAARTGLPFPALVEALLLEGAFEVLREAGLRMPRPIGQAISIVGVLVLGEAAFRAGIVGPVMIIVVGAGALASFAIPDYSMVSAFRVARIGIIILCGTFGLFGLFWGVLLCLTHLMTLRSFGIPYMSPLAPFRPEALLRDAWSRAIWPVSQKRPAHVSQDPQRLPGPNLPGPDRTGGEGGTRT